MTPCLNLVSLLESWVSELDFGLLNLWLDTFTESDLWVIVILLHSFSLYLLSYGRVTSVKALQLNLFCFPVQQRIILIKYFTNLRAVKC